MINYTHNEGIAEIVIPADSNPAAHGQASTRELQIAIWEASDNDRVKAIVIRRERGSSIEPAKWNPGPLGVFGESIEDLYGATGVYQTLAVAKKVTFFEAEGAPVAGDALFALYSDFVVASSDATFRIPVEHLPEANFAMVVLKMRLQSAKGWLLSGRSLSAADAKKYGLVTAVTEPGNVHDTTIGLARRVTRMPLDAIVSSKLAYQVFLDTQAVASEFDTAPFFAAAQALANGARAEGVSA